MDNSNLRKVILEYPNQIHLGQKFAGKISVPKEKINYKNLIICGMGGSALPAEILAEYLFFEEKSTLPVYICRDYQLPPYANKKSLIFISSYSGNTEETIACFEEALKKNFSVVAFTAGGKIETMALEKNIPLVKYKINFPNFQPRYAVGYAVNSMLEVLTKYEILAMMPRIPKVDSREKEIFGEDLARKIKGSLPVFYASNRFRSLAQNWKIKINENSKTPAFWNVFPEINHNEMVGFTLPQSSIIAFFFQDKEEHPAILKRIKITEKLLRKKGIATEIINLEGKNYWEKLFSALVLGDWVSYYLALEYNQDPTPVKMVEDLKKALTE